MYTENGRPATTTYRVQDAGGKLIAEHVREDKADGEKDVRWRLPDGSWGLNGLRLEDLPLYGAEMVSDLGEDEPVILVEGEKARDALEAAGIPALGTVCGAGPTPGTKALEVLKDREVVLWADSDEAGRQHMDRIAERLPDVAAVVRWFTWHDAPGDIKGPDAADHPAVKSKDPRAVDRLRTDLLSAPAWKPKVTKGLRGRILLGELLRGGIEPTPQLVNELVYEGRIHAIASAPGTGKTMLALYLAHEVVKAGSTVIYLDAENGPKLMAERLSDLGADLDQLDAGFHYYSGSDLDLSAESLEDLAETVEHESPGMVVFDSFADFLAVAGLEENSNSDCTLWMAKVAQPLKDAGVAVLVLDHVPKANGKGPRGASSKVAKLDVLWNLEVTLGYDRERTGQITLKAGKDREAWLPRMVQFSVGGGVFARSAGTVEQGGEDGLTGSQRTALAALKPHPEGLAYSEWLGACKADMSKTAFDKSRKVLKEARLVRNERSRWFATSNAPDEQPLTSGLVHLAGTPGPEEPQEKGTPGGVHLDDEKTKNSLQNPCTPAPSVQEVYQGVLASSKGTPQYTTHKLCTGVQEADLLSVSEIAEELRRSGSGPSKMLAVYLKDPTPKRLEYLTSAVLTARGLDADNWQPYASTVEEAIAKEMN